MYYSGIFNTDRASIRFNSVRFCYSVHLLNSVHFYYSVCDYVYSGRCLIQHGHLFQWAFYYRVRVNVLQLRF